MGLRFRKIVRLLPGVRLNFSKSGGSLSLGDRGLTVNLNRDGARATTGIPGSGLSYSTRRAPWSGGFGAHVWIWVAVLAALAVLTFLAFAG
jgi:hypothetical protein